MFYNQYAQFPQQVDGHRHQRERKGVAGGCDDRREYEDSDDSMPAEAVETENATETETESSLEEEGEEVYATNDKEGKYFPDRYWVDTAVLGNFQSDYFIEESKIYDWLSKITNGAVQSEKDVKDFNTYYEDLGDDDDNFIKIHKFDIID